MQSNPSSGEKWQSFRIELGHNYFPFSDSQGNVLLGLSSNDEILVSGCFRLQIVKGGIKYNDVHYSASWKQLSIWHPLSSSISPICSSFYAGWDERVFLDKAFCDRLLLDDFECVIRLSNGPSGLRGITRLNPGFKELWVPSSYCPIGSEKSNTTFAILSPDTSPIANFSTLSISKAWWDIISKLQMFHKNNSQDMRIAVIGGKNSGKSTLLRILLQRFLHGNSDQPNTEPIFYLDTDPGQPEYSKPDCISLSKIYPDLALGNHLCQAPSQTIAECYIGSSSPQDFPVRYLSDVDHLIDQFEEQVHMGTTLLNLPGWIKGFGIRILNHIVAKFKPTHIVFLESSKRHTTSNELIIPQLFSSLQRDQYVPLIYKVDGYFGQSEPTLQNVFNSSQLREFRILCYFHRSLSSQKIQSYNFEPLLKKAPLQVSFGTKSGINAFEFVGGPDKLHSDDIKSALEGTVAGLFTSPSEVSVVENHPFKIIEQPTALNFLTMAIIHSINVQDMFINLYIPESDQDKILKLKDATFFLRRVKTQTPLCELYPPDGLLSKYSQTGLPFLAFDSHKKYEHIWKVRRNVMRRGHSLR